MTKEARIYNVDKTVSSISGARKTGQLCEKNEIRTVFRKNRAGGINLPDFSFYHNTFTTYCHKDSTVLAQKQKYRPMEQDRKPINKPMHLWVPYF